MLVKAVTDKTFEKTVMKSPVPVLVDFWADWCPPCQEMAPTVEATAKKYEGKVAFYKMNADDNALPGRLGIQGLPTLILFDKGKPVDVYQGLASAESLEAMIEFHFLTQSK